MPPSATIHQSVATTACGKEKTGSMLLVKKYFQVTNKQQPSKNNSTKQESIA
jgi:hypothetical protein